MTKKGGFQLSANFLVVIILSLVLFGVGMALFTSILSKGVDIELDMTDRMREQLDASMDDGSLIVIPQQRINAEPGASAKFTIGFWNEFDETHFKLIVTPVTGNPIAATNIKYITTYNSLGKFKRAHGLIGINVPKGTPKGQYGFNVEVQYDTVKGTNNFQTYDKKQRIYVVVI